MIRALYVGRFQPPHIGHSKAIQQIMKKVNELIIIIGSAQSSHSIDNPFTVGERIIMLRATLDEMRIDPSRYYLIPVPDASMHAVWVSQVKYYSPPFDIVYSNGPLTLRLFREAGIKVEGIPLFKREIYSATEVRTRMLEGEDWMILLPNNVVKIIKSIGGVERLRDLAGNDRP